MSRPKTPHPTVGEFEILRILWQKGPSTVRDVLAALAGDRAYTSVMSLLNVMHEKGLVTRKPDGRAFVYAAAHLPKHHESKLLGDLLNRVFSGSATALVARLLEQSNPSDEELAQIRKLISDRKNQK